MLYLIDQRQVREILSSQHDLPQIVDSAVKTYQKRPTFFTPYRNAAEVAGELIAPIYYPLYNVIISVGTLAAAPIALGVYITAKLFAATASLFRNDKLSQEANEFADDAGYLSCVSLATSVLAAAMAVASFFHSLASIVTRTLATIAHLTIGYTDGYAADVEEQEYDEEEQGCFAFC